MFYAEYCLIFKWNMTLTGFCQYLCDSPVCLVFTSNLPHITEYCIRVWSCHVTWAVLHVHLVEGVLCVRRVRCVSYWGCVRICVSVTSACLAVTDRVCVWDGGCECFLWVGGIYFFPIIPAGLRSPLCSHAHILHSFLLQFTIHLPLGLADKSFHHFASRTVCFSLGILRFSRWLSWAETAGITGCWWQ